MFNYYVSKKREEEEIKKNKLNEKLKKVSERKKSNT